MATDYRETHQSVSWVAALATLAVVGGIVFLAIGGLLNDVSVLWLDAALILTAVGGLVAWIVASIARY